MTNVRPKKSKNLEPRINYKHSYVGRLAVIIPHVGGGLGFWLPMSTLQCQLQFGIKSTSGTFTWYCMNNLLSDLFQQQKQQHMVKNISMYSRSPDMF